MLCLRHRRNLSILREMSQVSHKLGSSMTKVEYERLKYSVDHVLSNYCKDEMKLNCFCPSTRNIKTTHGGGRRRIKSDNVALSELNADLWDRALITSLGNIDVNYFPQFEIVQKLINYILNSEFIDVGMITIFFSRLLLFHSPRTDGMKNYYWCILNGNYIKLNNVNEEEECSFWCLIEALIESLENENCLKGFDEESYEKDFKQKKKEIMELVISLNKKMSDQKVHLTPAVKKMSFHSLSPREKIQRILIVLSFFYDILESDFMNKVNRKKNSDANRGFLSTLLWPNSLNVGVMNEAVKKLIHVYTLMEQQELSQLQPVHKMFITLLAELARRKDAVENPVFPSLGYFTKALALEFSLTLSKEHLGSTAFIRAMKPYWLRLLVCTSILSRITGKSCCPELTTALSILEHIIKVRNSKMNSNVKGETSRKRKNGNDDSICVLCSSKMENIKKKRVCNPNQTEPNKKLKTCSARQMKISALEETRNNRTGSEKPKTNGEVRRAVMEDCVKCGYSINPEDTKLIIDLCLLLVESYFITHRTWDVYRQTLVKVQKVKEPPLEKWDYLRYTTDIPGNINKLVAVLKQLTTFKEYKNILEPFMRNMKLEDIN